MKVIILAGGFGTRLSEETDTRPKPMVEIGDRPIIWHIMKLYSTYGFDDFIILLGYKGYLIKEYFSNYFLHQSNISIDLKNNKTVFHNTNTEPWKITLLETGLSTMTGGRIKRAKDLIGNETFLLTYGDGISDVNIPHTIEFHKKHNKKLTMTAVQPEGRYGALKIENNNSVSNFEEKPLGDGTWINGGFFVCEPSIIELIKDDSTVFEEQPLNQLSKEGELMAMKHDGFWACMDTMRDKNKLLSLWNENKAPWKIWG